MDNVKNYDMGGHAYINIPPKIKKIEAEVFSDCTNLNNITISEGVEEIERYAFAGTSLKEIEIPSGSTNEYLEWFGNCKLPNGVNIYTVSQIGG